MGGRNAVIKVVSIWFIRTDKSPQLMEFVGQIKANAETASIFESIQADAAIIVTTTGASVELMDLT